jgi:hypothetical protein
MNSGNQQPAAAGASAATGLAVGTYKVHHSALALPSTSTTASTTSTQPTTALAAAQHAAALAASDSLYYSHTVDHHGIAAEEDAGGTATCSGKVLGLVSQSLPLLLTVVIVYIYYIYTVHVCGKKRAGVQSRVLSVRVRLLVLTMSRNGLAMVLH